MCKVSTHCYGNWHQFYGVIFLPESKSGFCPVVTAGTIGTCGMSCQDDGQCQGDQKCCYNGCGYSCAGMISFE